MVSQMSLIFIFLMTNGETSVGVLGIHASWLKCQHVFSSNSSWTERTMSMHWKVQCAMSFLSRLTCRFCINPIKVLCFSSGLIIILKWAQNKKAIDGQANLKNWVRGVATSGLKTWGAFLKIIWCHIGRHTVQNRLNRHPCSARCTQWVQPGLCFQQIMRRQLESVWQRSISDSHKKMNSKWIVNSIRAETPKFLE